MANNEQNLVPMNRRTKEEQRKISSAGGKASGKARRAKKQCGNTLNCYFRCP